MREDFKKNSETYLPDVLNELKPIDCFTFDPAALPMPVNIYVYDGGHSVEKQAEAFKHFNSAFADTFIAIVDDWSWDFIREGAFKGFKDLNYTIVYEKAFPGNNDAKGWWNGYYIAVIRKNP